MSTTYTRLQVFQAIFQSLRKLPGFKKELILNSFEVPFSPVWEAEDCMVFQTALLIERAPGSIVFCISLGEAEGNGFSSNSFGVCMTYTFFAPGFADNPIEQQIDQVKKNLSAGWTDWLLIIGSGISAIGTTPGMEQHIFKNIPDTMMTSTCVKPQYVIIGPDGYLPDIYLERTVRILEANIAQYLSPD